VPRGKWIGPDLIDFVPTRWLALDDCTGAVERVGVVDARTLGTGVVAMLKAAVKSPRDNTDPRTVAESS
jgi:hypothetical protein